jgi:alpha-beta hydrolase superfamily lysophospholipase
MGNEHLEALWKALTRGGGGIVAEWFMLFVFGVSAGSAVAALYARQQQ